MGDPGLRAELRNVRTLWEKDFINEFTGEVVSVWNATIDGVEILDVMVEPDDEGISRRLSGKVTVTKDKIGGQPI